MLRRVVVRTAAAALVATAAAAAYVAWRRLADGDRALSHTSRWSRNARLARLGAQAGTSLAVHRARRVFADALK